MKQRRFGKKVQNWHRSLGRFEKSRASVRRSVRKARTVNEGTVHRNSKEEYWISQTRTYQDEREEGTYLEDNSGDMEDLRRSRCVRFIREVFEPITPRFRDDWVSRDQSKTDAEKAEETLSSLPLEIRLKEHAELLCKIDEQPRMAVLVFQKAIRSQENLRLLEEIGQIFNASDLRTMVSLFSPFWIRDPFEWDGTGGLEELLAHVFCRYPVPTPLYEVWKSSFFEVDFKWLYWFILIGQGASLKQAASHFDWQVSSKFQQLLFDAPTTCSPLSMCVYAEVVRLGGSSVEFELIDWFCSHTDDPTEVAEKGSIWSFFRGAIHWFRQHREELSVLISRQILEWAMHENSEALRCGKKEFSWKRRSLRAALRHSRRYQDLLRISLQRVEWSAHGLAWEFVDDRECKWSFVELTTTKELNLEWRELHNCVALYAPLCARGLTAIVSLQKDGIRKITIAVALPSKEILQACGALNRSANVDEYDVIRRWSRYVLFPIQSHTNDRTSSLVH